MGTPFFAASMGMRFSGFMDLDPTPIEVCDIGRILVFKRGLLERKSVDQRPLMFAGQKAWYSRPTFSRIPRVGQLLEIANKC